ncbi:three-helix bundle dimerization domain-containing protein [Streptomyces sp. NPDC015130]|uniref:three-helix bundle dimerization domain-containing protein n=1 Tax=Streptomyces sp. NPDC015130 TaxID=3364940 RepID=UPI0036FF0E5E
MTASSHPVLPEERLAAGVARLAVRHQGRYSLETVQRLIADSYEQLAESAHVSTHLVVLAERFAAASPPCWIPCPAPEASPPRATLHPRLRKNR